MASDARVAVVTGGNSGMGMSLVRDLVARGWKVAVADIKENKEFADELGESASFHQCNVADYDSQANMFSEVWGEYGRIDALCANAGIVDRRVPPKPDLLCTDVDYKGVVYGTQLAIHFMRKNAVAGGKIVVVNFVRATARILKMKENITINAVCPGIVRTAIIPQKMVDAVSPECLTPQSTIVSAYKRFLDDDTLFGKVVECSADKQLFLETPKLANGSVSQRAVTVWDPLFEMIHKERSGLPDAIP
ncbi:15-hydroxyprostaglandin dehydrogenase [Sporormia fimetaria CBS 119925]|uniref:15-hydroxyprostaglandin dehydrogenase n=1 Tax=Sporormia fimetaria CBS 119925 TaxID=1340428 RepID=A0A6A6VMC9_9PLEO|nr:15-hydroxyprostaglandin dehydrogenase [Sporormia fimetaria CBS 119925]